VNRANNGNAISKFLRYFLAVNNVILALIHNYLSYLEGPIESFFGLIVLSFFILTVLSLISGSVNIIGNDFWFSIAFQVILAGFSAYLSITYFLNNPNSLSTLFKPFELEPIAHAYLLPGSLFALWTTFTLIKLRKIDMSR